MGWNTKADGTGHTITDATKYYEMSNWINPDVEQMSITLYAMWKEIELDIEYLATVGGTVDRVLDRISAVTGQHVQTGSSPIKPSVCIPLQPQKLVTTSYVGNSTMRTSTRVCSVRWPMATA